MLKLAALALLVASASAAKNCAKTEDPIPFMNHNTLQPTDAACASKCIGAKYVFDTSNCLQNTMLLVGCADALAGSADTYNTKLFSESMCGTSASVPAQNGHVAYRVKYVCSDAAVQPTQAYTLTVRQPGDEWRCNSCSAAETRSEKSTLTAFLLQFFIGFPWSAGLFYYELNALAGGMLAASLVSCCCVCGLKAKEGGGGGGGGDDAGSSPMAIAEATCAEILEEVQEKKFPTDDISRAMSDEEKGPYQFVFLQECEYMNGLVYEMVRGLNELRLGFKGELTMSEQMEDIAVALFSEKLPTWWVKLGFASTRALKSWRANLQDRCVQLDEWVNDPLNVPKVVDIAKLFNPCSFLTAIKQLTCQFQGLELDKLMVFTDVTKKEPKQVDAASRDGAYVTGMFLEGARWDPSSNSLEDSRPKEMFTAMPVVNCKAGLVLDKVDKTSYVCPTYCVPTRRPYFVFPAQLRTKVTPDKWTLAGVALILDIGGS